MLACCPTAELTCTTTGLVLRFHRFHMPAAAERPAYSFSFLHSVAAVRPSVLTLFPLVTLMDAMRSLDVSSYRAWPVTLVTRDLGFSRVMCHRPAYSYISRFRFM